MIVMNTTSSIMGLHLRYRLWIAELNQDITVLRIFDDYLKEIENKKIEPGIKNEVDKYKIHFGDLRKEIDELRHNMHLHKMQLAAESKESLQRDNEEFKSEDYIKSEKHYQSFRKLFDQIKEDFISFEEKSLQ